jgi:iron complex outermembrane receptor protein
MAGNRDSLRTYELEEVIVSAQNPDPDFENNRFTGGSVQVAEKALLTTLQHTSLSDYLSQNTPVFIKESGHGMLSTVSLRGTASSHTSVSWNGLTINPLTMGQVDFSRLPLFFFDRVAVHPGGESALYGNGAIGGGISLSSQPAFRKKFAFSLQETAGSFGYSFTGAKIHAGNGRIQSKSALFYNRSDNSFSFSYRDREEKQKNAAYHNYGLLEELDFKLNEKQHLGVKLWHTCFFRKIQPSMQNNSDASKYEDIDDRSTRLMADYVLYTPVTFRTKIAWINDHQEYKEDIIATNNFICNVNAGKSLKDFLIREINLKGGAEVQYIRPEVYAYKEGVDEWRGDLFLFSRFLILKRWDLTCNFRQGFVSGTKAPFTPSLGSSVRIIDNSRDQLILRANISRNFKVPTLNDRYWGETDNRYLKPEDGFNVEAGGHYSFTRSRYQFSLDATAYRNDVSNWIMWMPYGNLWKPQNIDRVETRGLELNCKQTVTLPHSGHFLSLNYAYTHAEVKKGFQEMRPFQGKQMPLLPEHTFSAVFRSQIRQFSLSVQGSYTGKRTTANVFDVMDAYFTANLTADYLFTFGKHGLKTSLNLNNLFDTDYQNTPFKAMPGRHFYFSLIYFLN